MQLSWCDNMTSSDKDRENKRKENKKMGSTARMKINKQKTRAAAEGGWASGRLL